MFLKLFSRYAERAHQGATVAGDHLRGTAVVVENAPKSLSRHDGVLCQNSALLKDHGCNLMHRKVLASFYQHLMAEAPMRSV